MEIKAIKLEEKNTPSELGSILMLVGLFFITVALLSQNEGTALRKQQ